MPGDSLGFLSHGTSQHDKLTLCTCFCNTALVSRKGKQKSGAIAPSFGRYVELVKLLLGHGALRSSLSHSGSIAYLNVFNQSRCYTTAGAPRPASARFQASQTATGERSLELNGQVQMLGCTPLLVARREMVPTRLLSPINREEIR